MTGLARYGRAAAKAAWNGVRSSAWPAYSHLVLVGDGAPWSITWDLHWLAQIASRLGIRAAETGHPFGVRRQAVFYGTPYFLTDFIPLLGSNRIGFAYFHGRPCPEEPIFGRLYELLRRRHARIDRVQVSHRAMRELVLESGIAPEKVFLIPIGINLPYFPPQTPQARRWARKRFGLPESAVVIGSFQKDGVGWGEGMQPKRIKGPDVFVEVVGRLKARIPELFVLLSGPSRGYVKAELARRGVPFRHVYAEYPEIGALYHALDLYLVTSREEGGPKAVLESMAARVPLVTTRVGQAADLVRHGENGWMVDVDDVEGLAHWAQDVLAHRDSTAIRHVLDQARQTAQAHAYERQLDQWRALLDGFVQMPGPS